MFCSQEGRFCIPLRQAGFSLETENEMNLTVPV